jgi:hypothetical protein
MSAAECGFVLDFYERLLIRKALEIAKSRSNFSTKDASILQRLEYQIADAEQIVLKGLNLANYAFESEIKAE